MKKVARELMNWLKKLLVLNWRQKSNARSQIKFAIEDLRDTRDDRLETVAQDIVRHFLGRGFVGKAMVVSIDKATALKMHDKVRKHWAAERAAVEQELARLRRYSTPTDSTRSQELQRRLDVLLTTDLSKIDFEALRRRFKESQHKNTDLEVLKAAIRVQLEKLIQLNKTRADFAEKFEQLIETYNTGSRSIEELFTELLALSRSLNEEQQRHVRENMSEEELVIFDILTRPAPELSTQEKAEVKRVARDLLTRLKPLLVLNWRQKSSARSQVKLAIEDLLDAGLPRAYTPDLFQQKCSAVFEHVYESYPEMEGSVYANAS